MLIIQVALVRRNRQGRYSRMKKMLEQPPSKNGHCPLRKASLGAPSGLLIDLSRARSCSLVPETPSHEFMPRDLILPLPVLAEGFIDESKLIRDGLLQASEMLRQGSDSQGSVGGSHVETCNCFKGCNDRLNLLKVEPVSSINL